MPSNRKSVPVVNSVSLRLRSVLLTAAAVFLLNPGAFATSNNPKKANTTVKQTVLKSPSEETAAQRDRRLKRECKGRPNAGACLGYASP